MGRHGSGCELTSECRRRFSAATTGIADSGVVALLAAFSVALHVAVCAAIGVFAGPDFLD